MSISIKTRFTLGVIGVCAAALGGCASQGPSGFTAAASDCKSMKVELNRLVSAGVAGKIQSQQSGAKLSAQSQAQVDRYNGLLNSYLGGGCANP